MKKTVNSWREFEFTDEEVREALIAWLKAKDEPVSDDAFFADWNGGPITLKDHFSVGDKRERKRAPGVELKADAAE